MTISFDVTQTNNEHTFDVQVISNVVLLINTRKRTGELSILFGDKLVSGQAFKVAKTYINRSGYVNTYAISLLGLPPECILTVQAQSAKGVNTLGVINLRRSLRSFTLTPEIHSLPLMVTSVGRSGSTLLMQLLAAHADIAVKNEYPMESTVARSNLSSIPPTLIEICRKKLLVKGSVTRWEDDVVCEISKLAGSKVATICDNYKSIHSQQIGRESVPEFYAEKNMSPEWLAWELFPSAKEIILVRDPRDMIYSSLAFNKKRGRLKFGRQDVKNDLDYIAHRAAMARPWVVGPWLLRKDRVLLVKYEDLITDPDVALDRIFDYLGLISSSHEIKRIIDVVDNNKDIVAKHSTTSSPKYSIGRWHRDMSAEMVEICNREFDDFIQVFGY